jgi:hypothetical protein
MPNPWVNIARGFTRGTQAYLEKTVGERKRREEEERQRSQRWADVRESRQYQREQTEESRRYQEGKEAKADIERKEEKEWAEIQRDLAEGMQQFAKIREDDQNERQGLREAGWRALPAGGTDKTLVDLVNKNDANPTPESYKAILIRTAQLGTSKTADKNTIHWWNPDTGVYEGEMERGQVKLAVDTAQENYNNLLAWKPMSEDPDSDEYQNKMVNIQQEFGSVASYERALEDAERKVTRAYTQYYASPTQSKTSIESTINNRIKQIDYAFNIATGRGDVAKKDDFFKQIDLRNPDYIEWAMLLLDPIKSKLALQRLRNEGIDLDEKDLKNVNKKLNKIGK